VKEAFKATIGDSIDTHLHFQTHIISTSAPPRQAPENSYKYCVWDAHTRMLRVGEKLTTAIDLHLTYNIAPLLIVSKDEQLSGLNTVMHIELGTIQINTRGFWRGAQKSTHNCTNDEYLL
jgi:hypothetical protein